MKAFRNLPIFALALAALALTGCQQKKESMPQSTTASPASAPMQAAAPAAVQYQVVLTSTWTPTNHPLEYPEAGVLTGPHFSGLIGASHGTDFVLFKEGTPPTPGLERLSEEGKHDPLNKEIEAAIQEKKAGKLFESDPLRDFSKTVSTQVMVSDAFPMVSVVAMIAPSPDWFTGAKDVHLKEGGEWAQTKTVTLYAWDSGGDDGATYKADDMDTNPKKPTQAAGSAHFTKDGQDVPVGILTFTKM